MLLKLNKFFMLAVLIVPFLLVRRKYLRTKANCCFVIYFTLFLLLK